MEGAASILILISGCAHAIVNAILKSGKDKMSGRALIIEDCINLGGPLSQSTHFDRQRFKAKSRIPLAE